MNHITGWAIKLQRANPKACKLTSTGLCFRAPGTAPTEVTLRFTHTDDVPSALEISIDNVEDARRVQEAMQDFIERRRDSKHEEAVQAALRG